MSTNPFYAPGTYKISDAPTYFNGLASDDLKIGDIVTVDGQYPDHDGDLLVKREDGLRTHVNHTQVTKITEEEAKAGPLRKEIAKLEAEVEDKEIRLKELKQKLKEVEESRYIKVDNMDGVYIIDDLFEPALAIKFRPDKYLVSAASGPWIEVNADNSILKKAIRFVPNSAIAYI